MIIKTNLVPKKFEAMTLWPFILIRKDCWDVNKILSHEMVHYREQAFITPFWVLAYLVSNSFRMHAEIRAYSAMCRAGDISFYRAVDMLMLYSFGTSRYYLEDLLKESLNNT